MVCEVLYESKGDDDGDITTNTAKHGTFTDEEHATVQLGYELGTVPCSLTAQTLAQAYASFTAAQVEWLDMMGFLNKVMDGLNIPLEPDVSAETLEHVRFIRALAAVLLRHFLLDGLSLQVKVLAGLEYRKVLSNDHLVRDLKEVEMHCRADVNDKSNQMEGDDDVAIAKLVLRGPFAQS
eukprot:scaffold34638_cov161-Amphora_coffeaeformis.AAC.20